MNLTPLIAFLLLPVMIVLLLLGHRFRLRSKTESHSNAVEGALFALFGLLLPSPSQGQWIATTHTASWLLRRATTLGQPTSVSICCRPKISLPCASYSAITSLRAYTSMTG